MKMLSTFICSALLAFLACSSFSSVSAAKYLKTDDSKELFKLEKIPLQVDSMKELSKHLTTIARREQDDSAEHRRGTGQLLALAMRLDPANQGARETNRSMMRHGKVEPAVTDQIVKAQARLRFFQRWLSSSGAGHDAHTLANYITDATRVMQPQTLDHDDIANWKGVVPPLERYISSSKKDEMLKPDHTDAPKTDDDSTKPKEKKYPNQPSPYKIAKLSVNMPLAMETATKYRDPNDFDHERTRYTTTYIICPVKLTTSPHKEGTSLKITSKLGKGHSESDKKGLRKRLLTLQEELRNSSSGGGTKLMVEIASSKAYSSQNGAAALAAVQLMLYASRANKELRGDIHLCASIDSAGKLCLPVNFWQSLDTLRKDKSSTGCLIVPKTAAAIMTQLLVFGEPDFFTRWEVFTVETMDEALAAASKVPAAKIAEAQGLYQSIRKLSEKSPVTKIAVNSAVRKRLSQITKIAPNHLSAKVLLLQGSGRRPIRLSEAGLAHHLTPIVQQMSYTLAHKIDPDYPDSSPLKKLHVEARAKLDPIERLINRTEGELYEEALKIANDLRSLSLMIKRLSRDHGYRETNRKKIRATVIQLQNNATALESKVAQAISKAAEK